MASKYPYQVLATFPEAVGKALAEVAAMRQTSVRTLLRQYVVVGVTQDLISAGKISASAVTTLDTTTLDTTTKGTAPDA